MNHSAHHLFMLDVTFGLVVLLLLTVVVAVGSNVLHRSVALEREIATRRVLGARRSDIARTFLLESMGPLLLGSCRFAARSSTPLVFQRTAPRRGPAHWRSRRGMLRNSRGAPRGAACIACCLWKERAVRRRLGQTRRVTTISSRSPRASCPTALIDSGLAKVLLRSCGGSGCLHVSGICVHPKARRSTMLSSHCKDESPSIAILRELFQNADEGLMRYSSGGVCRQDL